LPAGDFGLVEGGNHGQCFNLHNFQEPSVFYPEIAQSMHQHDWLGEDHTFGVAGADSDLFDLFINVNTDSRL
jgi:hypothetical protein